MSDFQSNAFKERKTIFSVLCCGTVSLVTFLVLPLYVGLMADSFGFTESQLGILASMDLIGIALMSLSAPLWIDHLNWRKVLRWALLWLLACNLLSAVLTELWSLCLIRLLAGMSGGLIAVMVMKSISYTRNPDRLFAIFVVCQVILQIVGFLVLPTIMAHWDVAGFFGFLNVIALLGLVLSQYFPTTGMPLTETGSGTSHNSKPLKPVLALMGIILFFITQVSLFSFIERLGVDAGFSDQDIGAALTVAVIIGLTGAVAGAIISVRFGRLIPVLIAGLVQLGCFYGLAGDVDYTTYIILVSLIQLFWNLPLGYHVGILISEDPGHRFIVIVPFVQVLGVAAGPFLGGMALEYGGYNSLIILAAVSLVLYLTLLLPMARSQDKLGYA